MLEICKMFSVVEVGADKLISALQNDDFTDFEDCLQVECAKFFTADYIVTRNTKDYIGSAVPVIEPSDFVDMLAPDVIPEEDIGDIIEHIETEIETDNE